MVAVAVLFASAGSALWLGSQTGYGRYLVASASDRVATIKTGFDPLSRCLKPTQRGGTELIEVMDGRDCYRYGEQREFEGIYFDEFEGQIFIEGARPAVHYKLKELVWLTIDENTNLNGNTFQGPKGSETRVWYVKFIGRRTTVKGSYGHMGVFENDVAVDKVLTARLVKSGSGYLSQSMTTWPDPIANSDNPH